jgi:lysophospholipase L1-like esterase
MSRPRIVALGDSTTAGTPGFLSPVEAPPDGAGDVTSQYAHWLVQARPHWDVLNRGVNGERSDEIAARFERHVRSADPRAVVIIAGVNDVYQGRTVEHVTGQLQSMYASARRAGIPVVAGTILPYDTATAEQNEKMHRINAWISQPASGAGVIVVDTRRAVAAPDSADRLHDSLDGLHPSPQGYRLMAGALLPALDRLLGR